MASKQSHIGKATTNEGLLQPLNALAVFPDWAITVNFYAAVHWIRAFLASHGIGTPFMPEPHYDQFPTHLRAVARKLGIDLEDLIDEFNDLKDLSQDARYKCWTTGEYHRKLPEAEAALREIKAILAPLGVP